MTFNFLTVSYQQAGTLCSTEPKESVVEICPEAFFGFPVRSCRGTPGISSAVGLEPEIPLQNTISIFMRINAFCKQMFHSILYKECFVFECKISKVQ